MGKSSKRPTTAINSISSIPGVWGWEGLGPRRPGAELIELIELSYTSNKFDFKSIPSISSFLGLGLGGPGPGPGLGRARAEFIEFNECSFLFHTDVSSKAWKIFHKENRVRSSIHSINPTPGPPIQAQAQAQAQAQGPCPGPPNPGSGVEFIELIGRID